MNRSMPNPSSELVLFDDANRNLTACYQERNRVSAIGEWMLRDRARKDFAYAYFSSISNTSKQSSYYNNNGMLRLINVSAFLPHALLQLVMITVLSHVLHFFLRRLRQSRFVSQIISGILIYLFWNKGKYVDGIDHHLLYESQNRRLEVVFSDIGVFFYLFLAGLKMDASLVWHAGKKPFIIAVAALSIPMMITFLTYLCFQDRIGYHVNSKHNFLLFLMATFCNSYFFVQAEALSDIGLLSSELGRLAMSASIVQDFILYGFIPVFNSFNQSQIGEKNVVMHLLSFAIMVSVIILIIRPYATWIVRNTSSGAYVSEVHITSITMIVILMALASDIVGTLDIIGPLFMGLALPSGPPLGTALIRRIDLVTTELLLPVSFIIAGREMDWTAASQDLRHGLWLALLMLVSSITKVVVVSLVVSQCNFSLKKGALLGLIMNFKGIMETLLLIDFRLGRAINGVTYTYFVLTMVAVTSISTSLVSAFYIPLDEKISVCKNVRALETQSELRVLTYFLDDNPTPSLLDFFEWLTSSTAQHCTCIYALHLKELKARSKSYLISHHRGNDQIDTKEMDPIHYHFLSLSEEYKERITIMPFTSIVPQENLHQDICSLIVERNIALVVLPLPRKNSAADAEADQRERILIPLILEQAQCSVAIMVYHNITRIAQTLSRQEFHICVLFMGGPDDREVIAIASRMVYNPFVHLKILRIRMMNDTRRNGGKTGDLKTREEILDEEVMCQLQSENLNNDNMTISEVTIDDLVQIVEVIHSLGNNFDMLMVGRRPAHSSPLDNKALEEWTESPELGVIGDLLASSDFKTPTNILIVQQHGTN